VANDAIRDGVVLPGELPETAGDDSLWLGLGLAGIWILVLLLVGLIVLLS
jgi:hypothetical protein